MSNKKEKVVHNSNPNPMPSADAPAEPNITVSPTRASQSYQAAKVNATILGWQQALDLLPALPDPEHKALMRRLVRNTPAIVEAIANVAANHGGNILDVAFDSDGAREAIAWSVAAESMASVAEGFARVLRDDAGQRYDVFADQAMGLYALMQRVRRTPDGRQLSSELKTVETVVKRERASIRRERKNASEKKAAETPASTPAASAASAGSAAPGAHAGPTPATEVTAPTT